MSCIGTVGIVSILGRPSQTNQQINSVALNSTHEREFLYFSLLHLQETIQAYAATGATMANLSKGKFESLHLVHPGDALVGRFHETVTAMFEQAMNSQKRVANLRQTRDFLLPRLVSGELDVSDLDIDTGEAAA